MEKKTILRFCKDYKIPIPVCCEPYFSYFMNLYNPLLGTKEKFQMLEQEIVKAGGEDAFLESYYEVRDRIVSDIQGKDTYQRFIQSVPQPAKYNFPKEAYKCPNAGNCFVSIDLTQANFQAINSFDPEILNANSYREFIQRYTDSEYMAQSKYLRQVIFGALNPGKQIAYEQILRNKVFELGVSKGLFKDEDIQAFCNDEIIAKISPEKFTGDTVKDFEAFAQECQSVGVQVHIQMFRLDVFGKKNFFKKSFLDGSYELKCVPDIYFAQAYKHVEGLKINDNDMVFYNDGILCRMLEPVI